MASVIPVKDFIEALAEGLKERKIDFAVSLSTPAYQVSEIFIEEARELILVPESLLSQDSIRWILENRTPIRICLTIFTSEVTECKLRVMRVVSDLRKEGVEIPNVEDAISIQELSDRNLVRLLESLYNWHDLKISGRPLPQRNCAKSSPTTARPSGSMEAEHVEAVPCVEDASAIQQCGSPRTHADLYVQLRNGIKTYWTERYLTRFLKLSPEEAREIAQRVGMCREACGHEILYFFDRTKALRAYFVHLVKGVLEELGIRYEERPDQRFLVPDCSLAVLFFDGNREELQVLAEDYARSYDLIFVVPEQLRVTIGRIQDDFFRVIPLARYQIVNALRGLVQQSSPHHRSAAQTPSGEMR
jgi:hypothetical protein